MESKRVDFIQSLPPEISQKILKYLDKKDVLSSCLVSKHWYTVSNCNAIWKPFWDPSKPLKEPDGNTGFEWTLSPACKWKRYRLNHSRILNNWQDDKYRKYEMEGRWLDTTAYDGKTLIINNGPLDVYNINFGEITKIQTLRLRRYDAYMCVTNTTFITVKYKPCVAVYRKRKGKYKLAYMLFNPKGSKTLTPTRDLQEVDKSCDLKLFYPYWSNLMCILGDTLYIYLPHIKVLYAWELKEKKCLLEMESNLFDVSYDNNFVYICMKNTVSAYDKFGKRPLHLTASWEVIDKLLCNDNIIFVMRVSGDKCEFCAWEKVTGKLLHDKKPCSSQYIILHPTKNVLLDLIDNLELERKEITAYDLDTSSVLWITRVNEYSLLGDLHSVVAERFLLFSTFTRHIFHIYDTFTGQFLYSLHGNDDDDLFAFHDILLYTCNRSSNVIVHLYSAYDT